MEAKNSAEPQPSIAVLPFADMSPGKDNEWFSDGLAEEIINALTQIPGMLVIARTSAFSFKGKNEDVRKIAEALGVTNILEGSVRKAGNRIRVTAQLINATNGIHIWSERYDREMADVFAIQDEIASAIAAVLKVRLSAEQKEHRVYKPNPPAYEAYLKARYYFGKVTPDSLARGKQYAEQAIALDPGFALAHIDVGDCFLALEGVYQLPAREAMTSIRKEARRAMAIDPSLPEAHAMLGIVAAVHDYDWKEAERHFVRAMACTPVPARVRGWYAYFYLLSIGRVQEAVAELECTSREDPLNVLVRSTLAGFLLATGRHTDADMEIRKVLELNESFAFAHELLGSSYAARGMYTEALASAEKAYSLEPRYMRAIGFLAGLMLRTGNMVRAKELLQKLGDGQEHGAPLAFALFHITCGEIDKAVDWLERAIEQRHSHVFSFIGHHPMLRSSPRWPSLMRLLNLPETGTI